MLKEKLLETQINYLSKLFLIMEASEDAKEAEFNDILALANEEINKFGFANLKLPVTPEDYILKNGKIEISPDYIKNNSKKIDRIIDNAIKKMPNLYKLRPDLFQPDFGILQGIDYLYPKKLVPLEAINVSKTGKEVISSVMSKKTLGSDIGYSELLDRYKKGIEKVAPSDVKIDTSLKKINQVTDATVEETPETVETTAEETPETSTIAGPTKRLKRNSKKTKIDAPIEETPAEETVVETPPTETGLKKSYSKFTKEEENPYIKTSEVKPENDEDDDFEETEDDENPYGKKTEDEDDGTKVEDVIGTTDAEDYEETEEPEDDFEETSETDDNTIPLDFNIKINTESLIKLKEADGLDRLKKHLFDLTVDTIKDWGSRDEVSEENVLAEIEDKTWLDEETNITIDITKLLIRAVLAYMEEHNLILYNQLHFSRYLNFSDAEEVKNKYKGV